MRMIVVLSLVVAAACSSTGTEGPMGTMGSAGAMGSVGAQGPAGPQGPAGAQGPAGPQGPAGAMGAQGPAGSVGATGAQGPAGAQGPIGLTGAQGAQGPIGMTGAQGVQGPQGPAGAQGVQGALGPHVNVTSANGVQLGILLSATPGNEMYVSKGDVYTLVPDGLIIPMAREKVWYVNNDCTGTPYAVETMGYEVIAQYVYVGEGNVLYTAATARAFSTPTVVQSYSTGGATCTAQSVSWYLHAMTSVGSPIDPTASMPWHIAIQ